VEVITQQVELVLAGTLESLDRAAVKAQLRIEMSCSDACDLSVTFTEGSVNVEATAIIVATDMQAVARVTAAVRGLVTSSPAALSDKLGVRVQTVVQQVKTEQRLRSIIVAPPPPAPPTIPPLPAHPSNTTESTDMGSSESGAIVGAIVGGIAGVGLVIGGGLMMFRRRLNAKVVPLPKTAVSAT